jgi:hypothetical protein
MVATNGRGAHLEVYVDPLFGANHDRNALCAAISHAGE